MVSHRDRSSQHFPPPRTLEGRNTWTQGPDWLKVCAPRPQAVKERETRGARGCERVVSPEARQAQYGKMLTQADGESRVLKVNSFAQISVLRGAGGTNFGRRMVLSTAEVTGLSTESGSGIWIALAGRGATAKAPGGDITGEVERQSLSGAVIGGPMVLLSRELRNAGLGVSGEVRPWSYPTMQFGTWNCSLRVSVP